MATEGSGLVLLEQRAAAAEARLTALEAALAGIARTPDHLTILRGGQRPAAQTDVQRRCRRSVGTHLRAEEPGGAPAAGAAPSAHGAAANAADGRSLPGKYVTELTSIRAALLKASEEQSAMQNQLKEVRPSSHSANHVLPGC